MIKHIPHASEYIPYEIKGFVGEKTDLTDKGVLEIFGTDDALIFPVSRLVCDVERLENDAMESIGMGICYENNANLERMRLTSDKDYIISKYYKPHHEKLEKLVDGEFSKYGEAVIIDCHTYRKEPWPYENKTLYRPEICIGINETSWVSDLLLKRLYMFDIGINTPFSGSIKPLKYKNDTRLVSVMVEVRQDMIKKVKNQVQEVLLEIKSRQMANV